MLASKSDSTVCWLIKVCSVVIITAFLNKCWHYHESTTGECKCKSLVDSLTTKGMMSWMLQKDDARVFIINRKQVDTVDHHNARLYTMTLGLQINSV